MTDRERTPVFAVYERLGIEARQAVFGALNDAVKHGDQELSTFCLAASLLRTTSMRMILQRHGVSLSGLLAALKAPPVGQGGYDALQAFVRANGEDDAAAATRSVDHLPLLDGFSALKLSSQAAAAWDEIGRDENTVSPESIQPLRMLAALLEHDSSLRFACATAGLRLEP